MNIRESINKKIETLAERYQTGKDLWSGESLFLETEGVETEFREAIKETNKEPDPIKKNKTQKL